MIRRLCIPLMASMALAACSAWEAPLKPDELLRAPPSFTISDAAHGGAVPGFYFLPPMVPRPIFTGTFDSDVAALSPTVSICPAVVTDCGSGTTPLVVFSISSTPAIQLEGQQYQVNWLTSGLTEDTYRIHVEAGVAGSRHEIGFADAKLRLSAQDAKAATTADYIGVKIGSALPIKFRIETGIVGSVTVSPATATIETGETQAYVATVSDLHGTPLAGRTVTWTWVSTPASGVVASITAGAATDALGQTSATLTAGGSAGTATITATNGGASGTSSLTVNRRHYAYVANDITGAGTITVIRVPQNTFVATIPVGSRPWDAAVTPDASHVYVANLFTHNVSVIDASTNAVVATVPVGLEPSGLAVTPNGAFVYVANRVSDNVSVIATATNTVVATIPVGIDPLDVAITPNGSYAYATNYTSGTVSVISTASNTVVATVPGVVSPRNLAVTPGGAFVYVTSENTNTITVISTATNTVTAVVPVGVRPCDLEVTPNGAEVYVTNCTSNTVSVVSTASNTLLAAIAGAALNSPNHVAFTPDGAFAYVANRFNNSLAAINTATRAVVASIPAGTAPNGVAISP